MKPHFTKDFFAANRQKLITLVMAGMATDMPIVLTANGLLQKSTDTAYPFRQDGSFWYLTGVDEPNVLLVIDGNNECLIIPELSETREAFDGAIDSAALQRMSGVKNIHHGDAGKDYLTKLVKASHKIGTLMPADQFIEPLGMYTNPARGRLVAELTSMNDACELVDIRPHIARMRMVKQPVEIEAIQCAIDVTLSGINAVYKGWCEQKYQNEFEIELVLTKAFHTNGGNGHSFEPIIAGGGKAATIHPSGNDRIIDYSKGMLLDVGAEYGHYAADISRTWMPPGNKRFQAVYTAVKDVADYAMTLLKPGILLREYEKQVEARMGEELCQLGLTKHLSHEAIRTYFPHAASHFLGIDVHDTGDYDQPLSEGVVITVEPGIYIPKEGIGVRIENDVLVTQQGCRNLSK